MNVDPDVRTPAVATAGVGVLLVVVQGTGAVPAELLGPDVVLAAAGFLVTAALLRRATEGRVALGRWYGGQFRLRAPLLVAVPAVVLGLTALGLTGLGGTARQTARVGADALASAVGLKNWWDLVSALPRWAPALRGFGLDADWSVEHTDRIGPLGAFWLLAVLVQLAVAGPVLVAVLHRLTARVPRLLGPALSVLAVAAAAVGPLRALAGASQAELAFGTHVRAAEWLFGAAAAAFALAPRSRRVTARVLTGAGVALLVATSVLVAVRPQDWLGLGGPAVAALGVAAVLFAVAVRPDLPLAAALGRGFPLELGRVAYPLLALHLLVYRLVQTAVPDARPFALLVVGGALAWLLALLVQDGLVRRLARHRVASTAAVLLLLAAVVTSGVGLMGAAAHPSDRGPVVLVLGGADASLLATALTGPGRYTVVDASLPGCGLLPPQTPVAAVRTSAHAQLAAPFGPHCGDWAARWAGAIIASAPEAIVVDLSVDADDPAACEAGFRARYRVLLDQAVAVWTAGTPDRPVLVADVPESTRTGRCLGALLAESVAARGALVPLDVQAPSRPGDGADQAENGSVVDGVLAAELGPERTAARRQERLDGCGGFGGPGC